MSEIRRYPPPALLKRRPRRDYLAKAVYWNSAITENAAHFAHVYMGRAESMSAVGHHTPSHTVRRTGRMLRIVELCLTALACGPIGKPRAKKPRPTTAH